MHKVNGLEALLCLDDLVTFGSETIGPQAVPSVRSWLRSGLLFSSF